jgi:hypothetical protein
MCMPVTVEIIKHGRVTLQTYSDPLEINDMYALKTQMQQEILPAAAGKMHIIADFRLVRRLPTTLLSRGAFMLNNAHPNTGIVVVIIENPLVNRMARAFTGLTPKQSVKVVRSFNEAEKTINQALDSELLEPSTE